MNRPLIKKSNELIEVAASPSADDGAEAPTSECEPFGNKESRADDPELRELIYNLGDEELEQMIMPGSGYSQGDILFILSEIERRKTINDRGERAKAKRNQLLNQQANEAYLIARRAEREKLRAEMQAEENRQADIEGREANIIGL